jgi:hypothetical protein
MTERGERSLTPIYVAVLVFAVVLTVFLWWLTQHYQMDVR